MESWGRPLMRSKFVKRVDMPTRFSVPVPLKNNWGCFDASPQSPYLVKRPTGSPHCVRGPSAIEPTRVHPLRSRFSGKCYVLSSQADGGTPGMVQIISFCGKDRNRLHGKVSMGKLFHLFLEE